MSLAILSLQDLRLSSDTCYLKDTSEFMNFTTRSSDEIGRTSGGVEDADKHRNQILEECSANAELSELAMPFLNAIAQGRRFYLPRKPSSKNYE